MKNSVALATATLVAQASALGSLAVQNFCPFDIYLWSVASGDPSYSMITLPANTPSVGYRETFRNLGTGISIKAAPYYYDGNQVPGIINQLEYTVAGPGSGQEGKVFYDLSWVNRNAFEGIPLTMQTNMGCDSGTCYAGQSCDIGYLTSKDDVKTHACSSDADIIFSFCSLPVTTMPSALGAIAWGSQVGTAIEPREADEKLADANTQDDSLAVCIGLGGGIAGLCEESSSTTTSTTSSSTTTSSTTTTSTTVSTTPSQAPKATAAPVVALQQSSAPAPAPAPASSSASQAAAPVNAVSKWLNVAIPQSALTDVSAGPVTKWYTYTGGLFSRDVEEEVMEKREAHIHQHLHNHQSFHRRNRIIKR